MKSVTIPYRQQNHGDFDAEWPVQDKVTGWWYITGYFPDPRDAAHLYSYQFTVAKFRLFVFAPWVLHLALTDVQSGRHEFVQKAVFSHPDIYVTGDTVHYLSLADLKREADCMRLTVTTETFDLALTLDKGKGATWHADKGVLAMGGEQDPRQRTVYYSYTNMPTTGQAVIRDPGGASQTMPVRGKSWFDRQWGPYSKTKAHTNWEWFSLRFFDDEEVMLFSFPHRDYYDGTYIGRGGERQRLRDYTITPRGFTEARGLTFSKGWDVVLPGVKEERYEIRPLTDGQINLFYFELIAGIYNSAGQQMGLCMVELLPGVRNPQSKLSALNIFKKA